MRWRCRALRNSTGVQRSRVHAYLDVDHDLVAVALVRAPDLFAEYIRQVATWFAERVDATPD